MNLITMKSRNWVVAMAMLALPGMMLTSCSKDTDPVEQVAPQGKQLSFSVKGIKIAKEGEALRQSAGRSTVAAKPAYKVYEFSDVDVAVASDNKLPIKAASSFAKGQAGAGLRAALGDVEDTELMEDGTRYVVFLYKDGTKVGFGDFVAGEEAIITLDAGQTFDENATYDWKALSYNRAEEGELPTTDAEVSLPENTDVLYASGQLTPANNHSADVEFEHKFARLGIELNTIGAFGEIKGNPVVSVSGLNLRTGSLDIATGNVTANGDTYTLEDVDYADFVNVDPDYNDAKILYVYTAPLDAAQDFVVNVKGLTIEHVDDSSVERSFFADGQDFTLNVQPLAGHSHHLAMNVVESALSHENVNWGRSNLYFRGEGGARNYAFNASNTQNSRADSYFAWGSVKPMQFASRNAEEKDPCALVYPAGLWKQPTDTQISTLTSGQGLLSGLLSAIGNLVLVEDRAPNSLRPGENKYVQYTDEEATANFDEASNNLRFNYNGQITDIALLNALAEDGKGGLIGLGLSDLRVDLAGVTLVDLGLDQLGLGLLPPAILEVPLLGTAYGDQAAFWSGNPALEIELLESSVGSWGYSAYTTQLGADIVINPFTGETAFLPAPFSQPFVRAQTTAELLSNVDVLGLDLANTSFKNVRCVRAN